MKKKLFVGLFTTLILGCGLAFGGAKNYVSARAEDEIGSVATIESDGVVEEEEKGVFEEISQWAKDSIAICKEVLNQPIVIGGVSVTLGTILLFVISKLVGSLSKKEIKKLGARIEELVESAKNNVSKKDYNALVKDYNALLEIVNVITPSIKNIPIRENAKKLLLELKPIVDSDKEFVVEETKIVIDDTKEQLNKNKSEILEILNRD